MVLVRRKRVLFHDVPASLRHLIPDQTNPANAPQLTEDGRLLTAGSEVFYIPETGEVFVDYEYVSPSRITRHDLAFQ